MSYSLVLQIVDLLQLFVHEVSHLVLEHHFLVAEMDFLYLLGGHLSYQLFD